jgi:hypothetical protein
MLALQSRDLERAGEEEWAAFLDASREDAERRLSALDGEERRRAEELLHLVGRLETLRPVEPPVVFLRRLEATLNTRPRTGIPMRNWALALGAGMAVAGAWAYWRRRSRAPGAPS